VVWRNKLLRGSSAIAISAAISAVLAAATPSANLRSGPRDPEVQLPFKFASTRFQLRMN
jgi:hypothetical protein